MTNPSVSVPVEPTPYMAEMGGHWIARALTGIDLDDLCEIAMNVWEAMIEAAPAQAAGEVDDAMVSRACMAFLHAQDDVSLVDTKAIRAAIEAALRPSALGRETVGGG